MCVVVSNVNHLSFHHFLVMKKEYPVRINPDLWRSATTVQRLLKGVEGDAGPVLEPLSPRKRPYPTVYKPGRPWVCEV